MLGRTTTRGAAARIAVAGLALLGSAVALPAFGGGAGAAVTTAAMTRAASSWSAGRPGVYLDHFTSTSFDVTGEAQRRRLIALNAWEWPLIARIKAANPQAVVLVYKDLSSTRSYTGAVDGGRDADLLPTGVGYVEAETKDPSWFLTDSAGRRLQWGGYGGHWHMDVGDPDYQRTWLTNVRTELQAKGWDGVIMDNALVRTNAYNDPGPAKYPTDASMQAATRSMVAAVAPGLRAAGLLTFANISEGRTFGALWNDLMGLLDGTAEEHFANFNRTPGAGYVWDWGSGGWKTQVDQIAAAGANGKIALVKTRATNDVEALRYGLASYLLATDGRAMFSLHEPSWHPELSWDLGDPVGSYRHLGNSVYRRDFTAGSVIVNAASDKTGSAATIPLSVPHLDHQGRSVTSITLGPTRGAILRRSGAATTTTITAPVATTTPSSPTGPTTSTVPATTSTVPATTSTTTAPTTTAAPSTSSTTTPRTPRPRRAPAPTRTSLRRNAQHWASLPVGSGTPSWRAFSELTSRWALARWS